MKRNKTIHLFNPCTKRPACRKKPIPITEDLSGRKVSISTPQKHKVTCPICKETEVYAKLSVPSNPLETHDTK